MEVLRLPSKSAERFLDMQICAVSSPARDLYYFLTSSVRLDIRKQYNDQLLQAYVDALKLHLLRFQYEGSIPDKDSLNEILRKKIIYTVENAVSIVPIVTGDTQNFPDLEVLAKAFAEAQETGGKLPEGFMDPSKFFTLTTINIIKDIMKNAIEFGVI